MSMTSFKIFLITLIIIVVSLSFQKQSITAEEKPLVVLLNERIQTQDSVVVVNKVVIYPNEESLYGLGEENYGMPVKEEYDKGPIVVISIKKPPCHPWNIPFADDWI